MSHWDHVTSSLDFIGTCRVGRVGMIYVKPEGGSLVNNLGGHESFSWNTSLKDFRLSQSFILYRAVYHTTYTSPNLSKVY